MQVSVHKVPQRSPDDLSGVKALIRDQILDPTTLVAIMGKTEGNGCVNDFTRGFATQTLKLFLRDYLPDPDGIITIMSGGTEGVLSPHLTLFCRQDSDPQIPPRSALVLGTHHTRDFLPQEIGGLTMVETVAAGVQQAMAEAQLSPDQVHFVQVKCPLLTAARRQGSTQVKTQDGYGSMAVSRGASALGVGVAVGEFTLDQIREAEIGRPSLELYSSVASTSAGVELLNCEILVLGNSPHSTSDCVIAHQVMGHALDAEAIRGALQDTHHPDQIVNLFAKAEADPSGQILGRRHTMLEDSDISHTRMARAVVGAVAASVVGDPMIYVSGGSEHQGPPGGGPVAAIARLP